MKRLVVSAAVIAAATGLAPPANADQYDFISALDNRGVTYANIIGTMDIGRGARTGAGIRG